MSFVNIGGVWKQLDKAYVNINGVWKEVEKMFCNIGGAWKEVEGLSNYFMYKIVRDKVHEVNVDTRALINTIITKPGSLVGYYSSIGGGKDYFYLSFHDDSRNFQYLHVYKPKPYLTIVKSLTVPNNWYRSATYIQAVGYDNNYLYATKIAIDGYENYYNALAKVYISTGAIVKEQEGTNLIFIATDNKIFTYNTSTKYIRLMNESTFAIIESIAATLGGTLEGYGTDIIVTTNNTIDREYSYPSMTLIKTVTGSIQSSYTAIIKP